MLKTFDDNEVLDYSNLLSTLLAVEIKMSRGQVKTVTNLERNIHLRYWHKFDAPYEHHSIHLHSFKKILGTALVLPKFQVISRLK